MRLTEDSYTLIIDLPSGEVIRLDFRWTVQHSRMLDFSINASLIEEDTLLEVYRVDTKHGSLHEHRFWKSTEPIELDMDYKTAFVAKKKEIMQNYKRWIMLFKRKREEYG